MDPDRLGRYRIEGLLGRGGMGSVYAAVDEESGAAVALKVLSAGLAEDEEKFLRFEQEVAALARLDHPNIVRLLGPLERSGDSAFFAMERLSGETLAARLRGSGPLPVSVTLSIARPLFEALAAAHRAGVIHRDVKPSNIVLMGDRVVITDFGLARMEDITRLTRTGQLMGTLDYMSPEQCEGTGVDARSDLYSAGCVLHEMLCGEPPFRRPSPGAVLHGHLHEPPPRADRLRSDLPPGLGDVIVKLLEKGPSRRYADAGAVIEDLGRVRDPSQTVTFRPGAGPAMRPAPLPRAARRSRKAILAGGLVLLALAALLALRPWKRSRPPYPGRGTVEDALETIHRAIRNDDFPAFSACFRGEVLLPFFEDDPAGEFRERAKGIADHEYRAEIPIRGASDGEASVRMVSGASLPKVLGLDTSEPLRLSLQPEAGLFLVTEVTEPRGLGGGGRANPARAERERRMLGARLEAFFRDLPTRGTEFVRRMVAEGKLPPERQAAVEQGLAELAKAGRVEHEFLPAESRINANRAVLVVRCAALAKVFGLADDRFDIELTRSMEEPAWRTKGIKAHER